MLITEFLEAFTICENLRKLINDVKARSKLKKKRLKVIEEPTANVT